jgi:hypothetical protein
MIPVTTRALVPVVPRKYVPVVRGVQMEAFCSALRLHAAGELTEKASNDATRIAIIHEAMITAAPLADAALAEFRAAHKDVACYLIRGMAGA